MFKGLSQLGDMAKLMKQAQEMQQKMLDAQSELDNVEVTGEAGGGLVKVVGTAKGYSYGPAFKFEYVLLVPVKGKEIKITFDDWIFKQDEKIAINRATMSKFRFKVAELTVFFVKE
mgnify:CR=1 FL=1